METRWEENPNPAAILCGKPSRWCGQSVQILLNYVGCEARKLPAGGEVFFLDFSFYRAYRTSLTMSALSNCFRRHFSVHSPEWSCSFSVDLCIDDHGSFVIYRPASVRPKHLFDQNFDHDYFFKLPFRGAGCPTNWTEIFLTPS